MFPTISPPLREDIHRVVRQAKEASGSVNISVLAERVRRRHIAENVALEDIAEAMIHAAMLRIMLRRIAARRCWASADSCGSSASKLSTALSRLAM